MTDGSAKGDEALGVPESPRAMALVDSPVAVPRTLNGKKCEVPVNKMLSGVPVDRASSADAPRDPNPLRPMVELAGGRLR
jgi:hypothetical protein